MNDLDTYAINARLDAMQRELGSVARATEENARTNARIAESLESFVRLEEQHAGTRERLQRVEQAIWDAGESSLNGRLAKIELAMPGLKELRRWVVSGVLAGVGMIGLALVKLVLLGG